MPSLLQASVFAAICFVIAWGVETRRPMAWRLGWVLLLGMFGNATWISSIQLARTQSGWGIAAGIIALVGGGLLTAALGYAWWKVRGDFRGRRRR